jgi:hypothetical protein
LDSPRIRLVPISQKRAFQFIAATHRHLKKSPAGDIFRVAIELDGEIAAIGIAGRPCRLLQDGFTLEIARISSSAPIEINACSRLYGALRRAGAALGYRRFVTYTLAHEPGISLRAAGFEDDGLTRGGEWSRPSRRRQAAAQPGPKRRWIYPGRESGLWGPSAL